MERPTAKGTPQPGSEGYRDPSTMAVLTGQPSSEESLLPGGGKEVMLSSPLTSLRPASAAS